jgi:hypothetical protein
MDDAMAQMAVDVFAALSSEGLERASQAQPEAELTEPQVQLEPESTGPTSPHPAVQWRPQTWAREHATQAALVGAVVLGWLARLMRRGRRQRRGR